MKCRSIPLHSSDRRSRQTAEDEFQPAGTIRPEVELHFQRTANPFHEAFDEEEVVLDPYIAGRNGLPRRGERF